MSCQAINCHVIPHHGKASQAKPIQSHRPLSQWRPDKILFCFHGNNKPYCSLARECKIHKHFCSKMRPEGLINKNTEKTKTINGPPFLKVIYTIPCHTKLIPWHSTQPIQSNPINPSQAKLIQDNPNQANAACRAMSSQFQNITYYTMCMSYYEMPCHVMSCLTLPYHFLISHAMPYHTMTCHAMHGIV